MTSATGPPALPAFGKDGPGKAAPTGLIRSGEVIDLSQSGCFVVAPTVGNGQQTIGNIQGGGGVAVLVIDHRDLVTGLGHTQHGFQEVPAVGTIDPGGADNDMIVQGCTDRLFAGKFCPAIDTDRVDGIVRQVGTVKRAVEHIVR